MCFWGWVGDVLGRRWSMIIPAAIGIFITPTYLLTTDPIWIILRLPGPVAVRRRDVQPDAELPDRALPHRGAGDRERVRYHQAAIFGGSVAPVLTYFAVDYQLGFAIPMLIGTTFGLVSVIVSLLLSPETKGHIFSSDLVVT